MTKWLSTILLFTCIMNVALKAADSVTNATLSEPNKVAYTQDTLRIPSVTPVKNNQSNVCQISSKENHQETVATTSQKPTFFVSLVIALTACISAIAAMISVRNAGRSAKAAEAIARAAIKYSLTLLDPVIVIQFDAAKAVPEGYRKDIKFYNSGNQTVWVDNPIWEAQPEQAVSLSVIKKEVCFGQHTLFESDYPKIPIFSGFMAKIHIKFGLSNNFQKAGACTAKIRLPLQPILDDGSNEIVIPCKLSIENH